MSKFLNTSEFINMINSRHILNLSIELIIKAQALDKTFKIFKKKTDKIFKKQFKKVLKKQKKKKLEKVRFSKKLN